MGQKMSHALLPLDAAGAPLAVIFVDADFQPVQAIADDGPQNLVQFDGDILRNLFCRGVGHRQQHAIFLRKDPTLVPKSDCDFALVAGQL